MPTAQTEPMQSMPGHLIRRLHQVAVQLFAASLGDELTPVQFGALAALGQTPGLDQAALSAAIGYDRATIGGVIDRLQARGLVARSADANDRRLKRVTLTAAGRASRLSRSFRSESVVQICAGQPSRAQASWNRSKRSASSRPCRCRTA